MLLNESEAPVTVLVEWHVYEFGFGVCLRSPFWWDSMFVVFGLGVLVCYVIGFCCCFGVLYISWGRFGL